MARSGIQLCYPFEEKRLKKWQPPWIIQPKLDGERCRAKWSEHTKSWELLSSEQNIIISVPHINQTLKLLDIPRDLELDGELYVHGLPFEEIHSLVGRSVNLHPNFESVEYWIFDLVDEEKPQVRRSVMLQELGLSFIPPIIYVPTTVVNNEKSLFREYENYLEQDYEGMIVRHTDAPYVRRRSTWVMKFKPKKIDIYPIIGYKEEIDKNGNPKNSLGALICSTDGNEFSVGSGLTYNERQSYWRDRDNLIGKMCEVAYQHTFDGGVPRFGTFKRIIDTESCSIDEVSPL